MMNPDALDALQRVSTIELFHLSSILNRLMADPKRILAVRVRLTLGQQVRYVDTQAHGTALTLRTGTVVAMKDTQVSVRDQRSGAIWAMPYAAIELPSTSEQPPVSPAPAPPRPTREDFRVGDRVSFEDQHLRTRIGTITRINQKTATIECEGEPGWRVSFGILKHVIDV